jgi:hypothetical protein
MVPAVNEISSDIVSKLKSECGWMTPLVESSTEKP